MYEDVLPLWERCTYGMMGISGIVYSIYQLYLISEEMKSKLQRNYLSPGWAILGRDQDFTSRLWKLWRNTFVLTHSLYAIHVFISWLCFKCGCNIKKRKRLLLTFYLITYYVLFGPLPLAKLVTEIGTMYYIACTKNRATVWAFGSLKTILRITRVWKKYVNIFDDQANPTFKGLYFTHEPLCEFRLLSFALDKIEFHKTERTTMVVKSASLTNNSGGASSEHDPDTTPTQHCAFDEHTSVEKELQNYDLLDCFFYSLYLPHFFTGPYYRFRDFNEQTGKCFNSKDYDVPIFDILKKVTRTLFWAVILEFQCHYLYYLALNHKHGVMRKIPFAAQYGLWYCRAQFLVIYHHLIWCIPSQVSRFDGVRPYDDPCCVSGLYNMMDLLRKFDVGLHAFMKTYVYIPLRATRSLKTSIASFVVTFLATLLWHGTALKYVKCMLGTCLSLIMNYLGKLLETCSIGVYLKSRMNAAMELRVRVFLHTGPFIVQFFNIGYLFFFEQNVEGSASQLFFTAPWSSFITAYLLVMCHVHNAYYISARRGVSGTPGLCRGDKVKVAAS